MKKLLILFLLSSYLYAQDNNKTYKIVPIISSNPTAGTGGGVLGVLMYNADNTSSPSQAILSAQYTNTDSYSFFGVNRLFFKDDKWQSNTVAAYIYNNTSFSLDVNLPVFGLLNDLPNTLNPNFEVKISTILEQLLYKAYSDFYIGGQIFYINQNFTSKNLEGEIFLNKMGIESLNRGAIGFSASYDTRDKNEKFYPTNSIWINLSVNSFPKFFGSDKTFYNGMINARKYLTLGKENDVLALQYFGFFCSKDTPDGALAALGAKNILRGFPIGKYKTRFMNAIQTEYRYTISKTNFRLAPFIGYAKLTGGSKGTSSGDRTSNNGNYSSGGIGLHYILAKKYQLDYRIDIAYSSDDETSIYASINQAF